ncbi:MAG: BBE domain-containing protein [Mycolicibacterium sp.]|uniref:BBE domain-containing protein n=1 Tax=Mycolicibacterium sp. TaxID=2320850 RepID=UPI003D09C3C0
MNPAIHCAEHLVGRITTWAPGRQVLSNCGYVDPLLVDWPQQYYGQNLPRLQRIKAAVDPDNVFRFAQSIQPAWTRPRRPAGGLPGTPGIICPAFVFW